MGGSGRARGAGAWVKFRLLMWKNFLQQWRHPIQTAAEILVPIFSVTLILIMRWQFKPEPRAVFDFQPVPAHFLNNSTQILGFMNLSKISIAYSPESEVLEDVVTNSVVDLLIKNVGLIRVIVEDENFINNTILPDLFPPLLEELPNITPLPPFFEEIILNNLNRTRLAEIVRMRVRPYKSSADLRNIYVLEETTREVIAAVEFDDSLLGATELPTSMTYALRFPSRPRQNSLLAIRNAPQSWRTDLLFPPFETPGPRSRAPDGGNDPGYIREMFIALQNAISTELVSRITGDPLQSFELNVQRFPHPAYIHDLAMEAFQMLFPPLLVMSFTYTAINIASAVTVEKELQLKETLKIMGMPAWINWTAWFCKQFVFIFIATIFITLLVKINWFSNDYGSYSIFTHTPWTVIFFFLLLYLTCTIFFCFMMSGFFSKGSTAAVVTGVMWSITYLPAFMLNMEINLPLAVQYITCLGINSAMAYGFALIFASESVGGMQWSDFMSAPTTDTPRMLFGEVIIMVVVDCVIYMLVALYLEQVLPGPFGTPKPWYFLFHKKFWCSTPETPADVSLLGVSQSPEVVKDHEPMNLPIGVKLSNLTKVFGKNTAVNNLSLNIYDDQITVLLGHNGAGKSTTISMITGNLGATSGSVSVAGHDMTWHSNEARSHLGLCPQHNVLYKELTVREHLEFFARLKGCQGKEMDIEVETLIGKLELQPVRNTQAEALSGGQKRRLCVGIALSGDTRVVLLDEPTSGMDPSSRRALWDLLQKEKKGRSMILTTHFMDEADILGDRIAIMAAGQLQCIGSPYFLKRHYGVGYTLVVVKDVGFDLDACTQLLKSYKSDITVKEDRGSEVAYGLTHEQSETFEVMLGDLENNIQRIKFKNYGLLSTTMEDVFMTVGSELDHRHSEMDSSDVMTETTSDGFDRTSLDHLATEEPISGFRLLGQHVIAVWLKLLLVYIRSWMLLLLQLLVPLVMIVATLLIIQIMSGLSATIQRRHLTLAEGFQRTETFLEFEGNNPTSLGGLATSAYEYMFNSAEISQMRITKLQEPIGSFYLRQTENPDTLARARHQWLTGATFSDDNATAWFSNFGFHDVAISMAAVHNALLKARHPTAELRVYNHPLDAEYSDQSDEAAMTTMMANQLGDGVGVSMSIASAVYVMFYVKERAIRAKLLQKASGIQPAVLWGAASVFDWIWFLIISLIVIFCCLAFSVVGLSTATELGRLYLLLMVFGAAAMPLNYVASLLFKKPTMGFVAVFAFYSIFGYMGGMLVTILRMLLEDPTAGDVLDYILQFVPIYSLITAVRNLSRIGTTKQWCLRLCEIIGNSDDCSMEAMCARFDQCCIAGDVHFQWEQPGITRYLVALLITAVVFWIILMLSEYSVWQKIYRREQTPPPLDESTIDHDVQTEARHAEMVAGSSAHSLVASKLSKYYGKYLAVNQVSFSVGDSECFGLLGVNGAGKTSTFKMLMGDESVSSGDAFVSGYSVRRNINKVHENIGYCPQFDAVFEELTGRETLRLYSLLRGLSRKHSAARTAALAEALGFTKHLDKKVSQYSGGNKRKLSTAVSLLGNTRLVFVDEPTTGVDPAAKRQVWRAIRGALVRGRGVVLTSHSMEECEALCSRLTIMVNGRFQCLGSPQHLKNKYSEGFTLTIIMKRDAQQTSTADVTGQQSVDAVKEFVSTSFVNPSLMEEHQGLLTYYLADRSISWSRMFGIMERGRRALPIEDYTIAQTTLEQIFLQFTKYQQAPTAR